MIEKISLIDLPERTSLCHKRRSLLLSAFAKLADINPKEILISVY